MEPQPARYGPRGLSRWPYPVAESPAPVRPLSRADVPPRFAPAFDALTKLLPIGPVIASFAIFSSYDRRASERAPASLSRF